MNNEFELIIRYEKELQQVHIEDGYNSCSYINIKTKEDITNSIKDFIESYEVE